MGSRLPVIPKRLLECMHRWEYINFSQLVSFCEGEEPHPSEQSRYVLFPGMQLPEDKHKEYTFEQWCACFIVYMAAMAQKFPESTLELCTYFYTVLRVRTEFRGGMWRPYDQHFHKRAAASGNRNRSHIDGDLYAQCFTGRAKEVEPCTHCGSIKHLAHLCPKKGKEEAKSQPATNQVAKRSRPGTGQPGICYDFNRGSCSRNDCRYLHICLKCRGPTPLWSVQAGLSLRE